MSWQVEFLRLLAERDEARADQREAIDREDLDAATLAAHRRFLAELALEKLRAEQRAEP